MSGFRYLVAALAVIILGWGLVQGPSYQLEAESTPNPIVQVEEWGTPEGGESYRVDAPLDSDRGLDWMIVV